MKTTLRIRIAFPNGHVGPGKIALLEMIEKTGSITGAAKELGMTYRRAWHLLETLQSVLNVDMVETSVGGKKGGGASLTPQAKELISLYRQTQLAAESGASPLLEKIDSLLLDE